MFPKFSYHYKKILLETKTKSLELSIQRAQELSTSFHQRYELNFYEDSNGTIIGYQLGQNLNRYGSYDTSTVLTDTTVSENWTVTSDSQIRKIISSPNIDLIFQRSDGSIITQNQVQINLNYKNIVSQNIKVDSQTKETTLPNE